LAGSARSADLSGRLCKRSNQVLFVVFNTPNIAAKRCAGLARSTRRNAACQQDGGSLARITEHSRGTAP